MADAESNLVPSEAADQVEVALEEQAAADDGILYLNEYQYENDLVTDFARLGRLAQASRLAVCRRGNCRAHRHRHAGGRRQLDQVWRRLDRIRRLFGLVEQKPAPHPRPRLYRRR